MIEKECRVIYVKTYDFTDKDSNKHVSGANVSYIWNEQCTKENEKGFRVMFGKLPIDKALVIINNLPADVTGVFELTSNNELKLVDFK